VKTNLTARNLELSDRLRAEIERKLGRLDRVAHPGTEASVELIGHASHAAEEANVAEVTLHSNGSVLRSTAFGATPMAAFDTVLDKLERQVVRAKQRPRSVRERAVDEAGRLSRREPDMPAGDDAELGEMEASVVKIKRFDMVPMFPEDAIGRMEELGHAFFVFLNAEDEKIAILYRRRQGDYGLIQPVVGKRGRAR
jgi:ribosome hibernation promoting factor